MLNFERYRTLIQNDALESNLVDFDLVDFQFCTFTVSFLSFIIIIVTESECLKQIDLDEKFGSTGTSEKKPK